VLISRIINPYKSILKLILRKLYKYHVILNANIFGAYRFTRCFLKKIRRNLKNKFLISKEIITTELFAAREKKTYSQITTPEIL